MNPLKRITEKINDLTKTQKVTADYIMKYPSEVVFLTVNQLAKKVSVSTTTVMRLSTKLGFSGYSELQENLRLVMFDKNTPQYRLEKNIDLVENNNIWSHIMNHNIDKIQELNKVITPKKLEEAMDLILNANNIYCMGVRSGLPITHFLSYGLNRVMGNSRLLSSEEFIDELHKFNSDDLLIVTSFPRYAKNVVEATSIAKQAVGLKVLSFTDSYSSPIVAYSDVLIPCDSDSLSFHNSPLSSIVVADYLITAIASQDTEKVKARFDRTNNILESLDYHIN